MRIKFAGPTAQGVSDPKVLRSSISDLRFWRIFRSSWEASDPPNSWSSNRGRPLPKAIAFDIYFWWPFRSIFLPKMVACESLLGAPLEFKNEHFAKDILQKSKFGCLRYRIAFKLHIWIDFWSILDPKPTPKTSPKPPFWKVKWSGWSSSSSKSGGTI